MKNINNISKLSNAYLRLSIYKQADLLGNMAARIMYSTLPYNEQQNNIVALQSLLPGAKELLNYGIRAAIEEIAFIEENPDEEHEKCLNLINAGKIEEVLQELINLFSDTKKWEEFFGGENWKLIVKNLKLLYISIKNVEETKKNKNWEQYEKQLREMVVYMNVIDGISHNSGPFFEKIVNVELETLPNKSTDRYEYINKLERIMNAKELKNPSAVKNIVMPILRKSPDRLQPFKDVMWKIEDVGTEPESTEKQLKIISLKKDLESPLTYLKEDINAAKSRKSQMYQITSILSGIGMLRRIKQLFAFKNLESDAKEILNHYQYLFNATNDKNLNLNNPNISEVINKSIQELEEIYNKINSFLI